MLKNTEKRIIDSNDLVSQKVEQYTNFYAQIEEVTTLEASGFKEGIVAEEIECTYDPDQETLPTAEQLHSQAM